MSRLHVHWLVVMRFVAGAFCAFTCSDEERLDFYPKNPFTFEGAPFEACCQVKRNTTVVKTALADTTLVFSCQGYNSQSEISTASLIGHGVTVQGACVNLTVWAKPGLDCGCQIQGQPKCESSQYITVDMYPPSNLTFDCINYQSKSFTCSVDMPLFSNRNRVSTYIKWKTKVCSSYDSCSLTMDDNLSNLRLAEIIYIRILYVYNTRMDNSASVEDSVTIMSGWKEYDFDDRTMLDPVDLVVHHKNASAISVAWTVKNAVVYADEANIHINCTSIDTLITKRPIQKLTITERFPLEIFSMEAKGDELISGLHPFTNYSICASAKLITSSIWSDPSCLTSSTQSDVPARSPKTIPGAFTQLNDSAVLVYWQPLVDWDWNCPPTEGREYVIQEYDSHSKAFIDRPELSTLKVQTSIPVWNSDKGQAEFRLFSRNNLGLADYGSTIIVPKKENILPGPTDIKVVYKTSQAAITITWQLNDANAEPTVFWCRKRFQQYSCLNSFEWRKPARKGDNFVKIAKANSLEEISSMYGVAFSKNSTAGMKYSGIHWQNCIQIEDGNSTRDQGSCQLTKTREHTTSTVTVTLIIIICICGILGLGVILCCVVWQCIKSHRKSKATLKLHFPAQDANEHYSQSDHNDYESVQDQASHMNLVYSSSTISSAEDHIQCNSSCVAGDSGLGVYEGTEATGGTDEMGNSADLIDLDESQNSVIAGSTGDEKNNEASGDNLPRHHTSQDSSNRDGEDRDGLDSYSHIALAIDHESEVDFACGSGDNCSRHHTAQDNSSRDGEDRDDLGNDTPITRRDSKSGYHNPKGVTVVVATCNEMIHQV